MINLENNKNVWVFHHYATPPTMNGFTRPYDFGLQLVQKGFNFTVFSSSFLHFSEENIIRDGKQYIVNEDTEVPFVFVNTISSKGNGLKRVLNMLSFSINLFKVTKKIIKIRQKPDIIIASSPHSFVMVSGLFIA